MAGTGRRAAIGLLGLASLLACSSGTPSPGAEGGRITVVAAESSWGSIAAQLGGDRVSVASIVTNPTTDPHDYEPTAQDGRTIAGATYVILNGLGYDAWAAKAVDANPATGRTVLDIGRLLGLSDGDNPHRWYFPDDIERVIEQIIADYKAIDPGDGAYFDEQARRFRSAGLERYHDLLAQIRQRYAGTPVGASESIVTGLTEATGLRLLTPNSFLSAISEGSDPTAADKVTTDAQISGRQIKVFLYNSQNATPDVQALVDAARANGIEVAAITETPPEDVTFQDWQAGQLEELATALARATGR